MFCPLSILDCSSSEEKKLCKIRSSIRLFNTWRQLHLLLHMISDPHTHIQAHMHAHTHSFILKLPKERSFEILPQYNIQYIITQIYLKFFIPPPPPSSPPPPPPSPGGRGGGGKTKKKK